MKTPILILFAALTWSAGCAQKPEGSKETAKVYEVKKSDEEWKSLLSPKAYEVLRLRGTERAFTGKYNDFKEKGTFICAGCGHPLFSSDKKFDSGTGWPSFYDVVSKNNVESIPDYSHGWERTEVVCGRCGGHLGHVFEDGPAPTGLRYCINSVSLDFKPAK